MSLPGRTHDELLPWVQDPKVRDACAERCALVGDPPCHQVAPMDWTPCGECLRDAGIEPGDEFDQNAAVGLLL